MDYDCLELERRLAIGFNDYLSLEKRHTLVLGGQTLEEIARNDARFRLYLRETRDVIHWLSTSADHSIIWYGDADFPSFKPIRVHLPYMLFCEGERPEVLQRCVAVVGTRHSTYAGIQQAFRFGLEAVQNGICVISGFAEGIDQAAMRGAVDGEGPCIGVLGCGHDVEYPCLTLELRRKIVSSGGCVLSRFAPQTLAYKSNFISRNIILAAYSNFVVAVQAPDKSGTLNTCDYAMQMGKEIYVGSEGVGDRFIQAGTTRLFNEGSAVLTSLSDIGIQADDLKFRVLECGEKGLFKPEQDLVKRFGDRTYVVTKEIGSA